MRKTIAMVGRFKPSKKRDSDHSVPGPMNKLISSSTTSDRAAQSAVTPLSEPV